MPTIDIPDKICPHCGGIEYYHRIYKKVSKITGKNYEHYECRKCNIKSSKNYALNNTLKVKNIKVKCYLKYKDDPVRKEARANNSKNFREIRKDLPEYKEKLKMYSKKSFQTLKNSLSDRYIKQRLMYSASKKVLEKNDIPQKLIDLKRKELLLTRKIKNHGKDN